MLRSIMFSGWLLLLLFGVIEEAFLSKEIIDFSLLMDSWLLFYPDTFSIPVLLFTKNFSAALSILLLNFHSSYDFFSLVGIYSLKLGSFGLLSELLKSSWLKGLLVFMFRALWVEVGEVFWDFEERKMICGGLG